MPPRRNTDIEVFLSHSHKDKQIAEALVDFLVLAAGIETGEIRCTSYTPSGLAIGSRISHQLRRDIENCRYFMPLITPNSVGSEFVAFEIGAAWAFETDIKPLILGGGDLKIPALLQDLLCCDLRNLDALVQLADEFSRAIFHAQDRPKPSQMLAAAQKFIDRTVTPAR